MSNTKEIFIDWRITNVNRRRKRTNTKIRADLGILDNVLKKRLENKASKAEVTRIRIKTEESFNKIKNIINRRYR